MNINKFKCITAHISTEDDIDLMCKIYIYYKRVQVAEFADYFNFKVNRHSINVGNHFRGGSPYSIIHVKSPVPVKLVAYFPISFESED